MATIVLVTRMVASSNALRMVGEQLRANGYTTREHLADGEAFHFDPTGLEGADFLLTGMGGPETEAAEELAAIRYAIENDIPFGLYADTFGAVGRPYFQEFREKAVLVFVVSNTEVDRAKKCFPNAVVVVSGSPTWEKFFFPTATREEVLEKLEIPGIEKKKVILVPGGKHVPANILHFGAVIEAASGYSDDCVVLITLHPGEMANNPGHLGYYLDVVRFNPGVDVYIVLKNSMDEYFSDDDLYRRFVRERISSDDLVSAADVVVEFASGIGVRAVCMRKPVIDFVSEVALNRLREMTGDPTRNWDLCDQEVVCTAHNVSDLSGHLEDALYDPDIALRERQALLYPEPKRVGATLHAITEAIEKVVTPKMVSTRQTEHPFRR